MPDPEATFRPSRIVVLAGGDSAERDVSIQSGRCVEAALKQRGHLVDNVDPADRTFHPDPSRWDIAVPLVHGAGGEDGTLQRQLAAAGLPWVGSSVESSRLTFDKIRTNELLRRAGLPVPDHVVVRQEEPLEAICQRVKCLGPSVVTKPPRQGSSIGVSIIRRPEQLEDGLRLAFEYDDTCLVEEYIAGDEVTVALLDGMPLPSIRICPAGWYHYHSKYSDDRTEYVFEPPDTSLEHGKLAKAVNEACGTSGITRVDMRIDTDGQPFVLEINTIPGMTSHSLVPMAAEKSGRSLAQLFEEAIASELAAAQ